MGQGHRSSVAASVASSRDNPGAHTRAASPEQLPLEYNDRWRNHESWQRLLGEIRTAVAVIGLKQAAYDLDTQPSVLAHALAERERHYVRAEWLPYLVAHAPTDEIVRRLAGLRGLDVQARAELTPEEKLDALDEALDRVLGQAAAELVRRAAGLAR